MLVCLEFYKEGMSEVEAMDLYQGLDSIDFMDYA